MTKVTLQFNGFARKEGKKTAYEKECSGPVLFGTSLYVSKSVYVRDLSPLYTVIMPSPEKGGAGKHVSGLYSTGKPGVLIGDFEGKGLLAAIGGGFLDIFLSDVTRKTLKEELLAGRLDDQIKALRKQNLPAHAV